MEIQMNSVVLTAYNGMPYIKEQLESILCQLSPEDELIVSDNGSDDGTLEYVRLIAKSDKRIRVVYFTESRGVIPNISQALGYARGDLIFLSDQDDVWSDRKIRYCRGRFSKEPSLLLLQNNAEIIDANGKPIVQDFFSLRGCRKGVIKNFIRNSWQGCNMVFRREILALVLPISERVPMHDVWIGILAEKAGQVDFDSTILACYRRHADNQSAMHRSSIRKIIQWRFRLAQALIMKRKDIRRFRKEITSLDSLH